MVLVGIPSGSLRVDLSAPRSVQRRVTEAAQLVSDTRTQELLQRCVLRGISGKVGEALRALCDGVVVGPMSHPQ